MAKVKIKKRAFKIDGDALNAVIDISNQTHRNLTGAMEYLILQGYKKHEVEADFLSSMQNTEMEIFKK